MALPADPGPDGFLASFVDDPRLVHVERLPARPARTAELSRPLPAEVRDALGIDHFWSHQAEAIDLARDGRSVAVATSTASGKSLCFQAPIAEAVSQGLRSGTALLLFPTKALAHDQLRSVTDMAVPRLTAAAYDGDCSPEERAWARAHANVVLTNPEMLHVGLLPHHARWATFFMRLRYVVVDELHTLRGIFGSHVAHLLRRLRRICAHYGSTPTFVFTSATIGDPGRLASELCGLPVTEVTDDGSPTGERLFVLWNPAADQEHHGRSVSATRDTAELMSGLVADGRRTIAFCRSRKATELVAADVRRRVRADLADGIRPYRGGYLASERRDIEKRLFSGRLRGVVATTALELGIDVGGLDACVLNGFPGTVASMWQQAGRAGRDTRSSIAALVAGDDQLDQWFVHHPTELFTRPPEPAVVNPANPHVLLPHLACAAYELPLTPADEVWWPGLLDDGVRDLVLDDTLRLRPPHHRRGPAAVWARRGWPSRGVGLRSAGGDEFRIATADGTLVGTVDGGRALRVAHPGAVYLHQGRAWRVTDLDLDDRVALVEPSDGSEYTQPRTTTDIAVLGRERSRSIGDVELTLGPVRVSSQVVGYRRIDAFTGEQLGVHDLDLPPGELVTRAFAYVVPDRVTAEAGLTAATLPGALHALEHAAIGILPLFAICDRWDVGGVSTPHLPETGAATIVVYDGYPGGAGVAELGYDAGDRHLHATLEVIERCDCLDGCPSCVQSPKCGNGNEPLDKAGAAALLRRILGTEGS
ncbi:MAG: DEAD/DEAH box helicase [Acidimicrobiales bacterium]|nr:DEAD/DEAH box helicase [Acidimicrobiales bacterium]